MTRATAALSATPSVRRRRMRALVADRGTVTLNSDRPTPIPLSNEVVVEVRAVGLCRTDLYVISGEIPSKNHIIPGHEFSGVVIETGCQVSQVTIGQRVVVDPIIPCEACGPCRHGRYHECCDLGFLGLDSDGALAERVAVRACAVTPIPDDLDWTEAAFAEPVAAVLGVLKAGIRPDQVGLIFGDNRIAELVHRVLIIEGFSCVQCCTLDQAREIPTESFDFIVETGLSIESFSEMIRMLRHRGRILLKSRQHVPVPIVLRDVLPKEPIIEAVHYGRFDEAVRLLGDRRLAVDDLIGRVFDIEQWELALNTAKLDEQRKTFVTFGER